MAVTGLFVAPVKAKVVSGAPVVGLRTATLERVSPPTVLNVPPMMSLVPSGVASTVSTMPPVMVGLKLGSRLPLLMSQPVRPGTAVVVPPLVTEVNEPTM